MRRKENVTKLLIYSSLVAVTGMRTDCLYVGKGRDLEEDGSRMDICFRSVGRVHGGGVESLPGDNSCLVRRDFV